MTPTHALALTVLAGALSTCGAFAPALAPTASRVRATALGGRPSLLVMNEDGGLKFNKAPEGSEDAPVLDQTAAEVAAREGVGIGKVSDGGASGSTTASSAELELELRPVEELSEQERKDRARMLAIKKYAPWMADMATPEAIAAREASERERKANKADKLVGNRIDPAKQEVSGAGLKAQVSMNEVGGDVSLAWYIGSEEDNLGFIVQRKAAGEPDFSPLSSYETDASLRSKGPSGGSYTYVDANVPPGSYLYKVQDVAERTKFTTDVCQRGVDILSKEEQSSNLTLLAGFGVVMAGLFAAGLLLDPQ